MLTGILLANGNISASILNSLYNENLVKEGDFHLPSVFMTAKKNESPRMTGSVISKEQCVMSVSSTRTFLKNVTSVTLVCKDVLWSSRSQEYLLPSR